jgi:hypothetical protein
VAVRKHPLATGLRPSGACARAAGVVKFGQSKLGPLRGVEISMKGILVWMTWLAIAFAGSPIPLVGEAPNQWFSVARGDIVQVDFRSGESLILQITSLGQLDVTVAGQLLVRGDDRRDATYHFRWKGIESIGAGTIPPTFDQIVNTNGERQFIETKRGSTLPPFRDRPALKWAYGTKTNAWFLFSTNILAATLVD